MFLIKNTLVSLDLVEKYFCCDLSVCKGQCCIDGDEGAPLTEIEKKGIEENLDKVLPLLSDKAREAILKDGIAYYDREGDLVTNLVEGGCCVFTEFNEKGVCLCALEKGYREDILPALKPSSCHLYPVRLSKCGEFTAINLHKWKICKCAFKKGRVKGIRAYEFLKEPLIRQFGKEWYDELCKVAKEWLSKNS